MKIIPVVNLKNGHCVKLGADQFHNREHDFYSAGKTAGEWEEQGASLLHVIDVDGAMVGHTVNEDALKEIVDSVSIPVEAGGGIRSIKAMESILNLGVSRVVVSTGAVGNPTFIRDAIRLFGEERIIVAIDARNGYVLMEGWEKTSNYKAMSFALRMRDAGVNTIKYRELAGIGKESPDFSHMEDMIRMTGLHVIAHGGIRSLKDLERMEQMGAYGTIMEQAVYENRIDLREAILLFEKGE